MTISGMWTDGETKLLNAESGLPLEAEWSDGDSVLYSEEAEEKGIFSMGMNLSLT